MPLRRRYRRRVYRGRLDPFEFGLMVLRAYVRREGHACVPVRHRERAFSYRLGLWVAGKRQSHRRGELSPERISALEALPGWVWSVPATRRPHVFGEGVEKLRAYARTHGHARVPDGYRVGGFRLGAWVQRLRRAHRQDRLSRVEVRTLEAVPGWSWSPFEDDFERALRHLRAFVRRHGHTLIPSGYVAVGFPLGRWVNGVRRRRRKGRLSRWQQAALETVRGWTWDPRHDAFRRGLELVRRFAEREGHAWVPDSYQAGGLLLGQWVARYRRERRQGQLSRARIRAFEAIPGWEWERPRESAFERGLRLLRVFVKEHGHCRVPMRSVVEGLDLQLWVLRMREYRRHGKLTRGQERTLARLPGWSWEPHRSQYEEGVRHLRAFVRREGHARVPARYLEGAFPLGNWVSRKRRMRNEGRLSREWSTGLEAFPGWVWDARKAQRPSGRDDIRLSAAGPGGRTAQA